MCVRFQSHAGRERTPLLPDWQRESVPPLYFLLPLFLSAAASCHAPRRCQGRGVGSQSRRLNRRKRARARESVCLPTGLGQAGLRVWKTAQQERGVKPPGGSASHVPYRDLLIKFLAAVDHLTESHGAARRGKVAVERRDAATMSRESLFPARSPWRSRPRGCNCLWYCWCCRVRGRCDPRSLARHSRYLCLCYCFCLARCFHKANRHLMNGPRAFSSSPPSLILSKGDSRTFI